MPKTSRQIALEILSQAEREGVLAEKGFARLNALTLEPKEKALAAELVKGTLRWRGRIDYLLSHLSRRPLASLPVYLRNTLRLGAYQILFLDRVPHWAAVDESVKLARRHGHEGQVKYVNAVLRNLIRTGDQIPLPDPSRPAAHLAVVHAFPEWLASRWIKRFGAPEAARLMASCNIPAPLTLRVNRLKISPERFMTILADGGHDARRLPLTAEGVEVMGGAQVRDLPGFGEGWFYVQDPGAMAIARLVDPRPGERVLDACAAPGGKASHMAELMDDRGEVTALELDEKRIAVMGENISRLGLRSIRPLAGDGSTVRFAHPFDRVLIDAPCSGLGTLRRHPEAKWLRQEVDLNRHQTRQLAILHNISPFVRPGGNLVYATCSTEPEENEDVVKQFLARHGDFFLDDRVPAGSDPLGPLFDAHGFFHAYPHRDGTDGFFAARLIRSGP